MKWTTMFQRVTPRQKNQARKQFIAWLGRTHPNLANQFNTGGGFGSELAALNADYSVPSSAQVAADGGDDSWWKSLVKGVTEAAPSLIATKQQYDLMKMNMRRAEQGLPPIDSAQYAPTVRVQAEASPATDRRITQAFGIVGGLGILGIAAYLLRGGKRR